MTMLTIDEAKAVSPLAAAVLEQLGGDEEDVQTAIDAAMNGADGGFHGFTYTRDCVDFVVKHREIITQAVEGMASDLGEDPIAFVRGFNCLDDDTPTRDIARALYGGGEADDQVMNALAWFALEEVGQGLDNA